MNKPNMTCRVCGKEYFCCSDSKKINSWRTMACSPECFQEYMRRIEESRKPVTKEVEVKPATKNNKKKATNTDIAVKNTVEETENIIEE